MKSLNVNDKINMFGFISLIFEVKMNKSRVPFPIRTVRETTMPNIFTIGSGSHLLTEGSITLKFRTIPSDDLISSKDQAQIFYIRFGRIFEGFSFNIILSEFDQIRRR